VAWVWFGNAALRSVYLEVGGVEFFGHQTWPEAVASGWPGDEPRREFEDEWHKFYFDHLPDEPFVLERSGTSAETMVLGPSPSAGATAGFRVPASLSDARPLAR
jgi:hypothetical protein